MSPPRIRPGLFPEDREAAPDAPFATFAPASGADLAATLAGRVPFRWSHGGHLDPGSRVQRRRLEKELAATLPAGSYHHAVDEDGDVALVVALPDLAAELAPPGPPAGQLALLVLAPPPAPSPEEAAARLAVLRRGYDGPALATVLAAWPGAVALRFAGERCQLFGAAQDLEALARELG